MNQFAEIEKGDNYFYSSKKAYQGEQTKDKDICLGTTPDIYVNQSIEDYKIYEECYKKGTASDYNKKLEYDTVLKYVINH